MNCHPSSSPSSPPIRKGAYGGSTGAMRCRGWGEDLVRDQMYEALRGNGPCWFS